MNVTNQWHLIKPIAQFDYIQGLREVVGENEELLVQLAVKAEELGVIKRVRNKNNMTPEAYYRRYVRQCFLEAGSRYEDCLPITAQ